ncbi:permease [Halalkalibacillus sediminis]|uniref:Permease n=1 Tax=Halalkalibacillus sediminis TaxID=2018042 RepID=A0A2I0QTW7_9BACI|nr:permease [Halalkalibacillus sediminis]PKR77540.1 permease [Halalkalibacillus sediminis]
MEILKSFMGIALELTVLFVGISFLIHLIQGFIPYQKMEELMDKSHPLISALIAVAFAFVTPFCSCSTIPIVVNLLKNQVKFSIVMIFLFASPVLDLTIVSLMTVILGWKVALIYSLATIVLSIIIGFSLSFLGFENQLKNVMMENFSQQQQDKRFDLKLAYKETMILMKQVYPFLLIGAGIGAIIHGAVPSEWIATYMGGESWWLVPIAAVIGIPLYIRLSTMIPISQILIVKGMALGPVMALMIASAGASLPEVTMLHSIFKKKLVLAFVTSVIMMSTLSGFLFYLI